MAILQGFQVVIVANGKPCKEFADKGQERYREKKTDDSSRLTKYIEALPGTQFAVKVTPQKLIKLPPNQSLCYYVYLDGENAVSYIIGSGKGYQKKDQAKVAGGVYIGDGSSIRKFEFAKIVTSDRAKKGTMAEIKKKYANLGTVSVEIWQGTDEYLEAGNFGDVSAGSKRVPEEAIKGGALSVATSARETEKVANAADLYDFKPIGKKALAIFTFKCRSLNDLRCLSILPLALEERDIETLTKGEFTELKKRQKAAKEAKETTKRLRVEEENQEENLRLLRGMKRAGPAAEGDDSDVEEIAFASKKRRVDGPKEIIEIDSD